MELIEIICLATIAVGIALGVLIMVKVMLKPLTEEEERIFQKIIRLAYLPSSSLWGNGSWWLIETNSIQIEISYGSVKANGVLVSKRRKLAKMLSAFLTKDAEAYAKDYLLEHGFIKEEK